MNDIFFYHVVNNILGNTWDIVIFKIQPWKSKVKAMGKITQGN